MPRVDTTTGIGRKTPAHERLFRRGRQKCCADVFPQAYAPTNKRPGACSGPCSKNSMKGSFYFSRCGRFLAWSPAMFRITRSLDTLN
jgi:hypothetical protein